ncbi:hypothetical protein ACJJIF_03755 [Microbulbifer sp. SSSA002]|uniref:hypothetical protein n=1 Tax=Microbulbifer sp. SSSA002 TaxID=3243376 RepID=UPI00403A0F5D
MTILPPYQVPGAIAGSFPQLIMLQSDAAATISKLVENSGDFQDFLQVIMDQGAPSTDTGWARLVDIPSPNGEKNTYQRLQLSDKTVQGVPAFLASVLTPANNDPRLKDLVWTVQNGTVPGPQEGPSSIPNWTQTSLNPQSGVLFQSVGFSGDSNSFQLLLANDMACHLGVYVEFFQGGKQVTPKDWVSRLPASVTSAYESATRKYLGLLKPTTAVAGIPVASTGQSFDIPLPDNAEQIKLVFGGIGRGGWDACSDAAGLITSYILDISVPMILANAQQMPTQSWYDNLLSDQELLADILNAGDFLLNSSQVNSVSGALGCLSGQLAALFLSEELSALKQNINTRFGQETVENALPYLGWSAQTLKALLDSGEEPDGGALATTTAPLLARPPSFDMPLAPTSLIDLKVTIEADKTYGQWPLQTKQCEIDIEYAGGFTQKKSVDIDLMSLAQPIVVNFGSIINKAPVSISVSCFDSGGSVVATGEYKGVIDCSERLGSLIFSAQNMPVTIDESTAYKHYCKLAYSDGHYLWQSDISAPSAIKTDLDASSKPSGLVDITLQQANASVGYSWRASSLSVTDCSSGNTLSTAYFFQNVGTVLAEENLKVIDCGFALQPGLVYWNAQAAQSVLDNSSFYLDPRSSQFALRPVDLHAGRPFDLTESTTAGRFLENGLTGLSIHPEGCAVACSWANSKLEIVQLSDSLTSDSNANRSQLLCGEGSEQGLLNGPIGTAVTPSGFILVLEAAGRRLQAFDLNGNPTPLFSGSPYLPLQESDSACYLDLAVSPGGIIYVLSHTGDGSKVNDYYLDLYRPDGDFISRTAGVNGARIEVDSRGVVYTLNYEAIDGPAGRAEPSISKWIPTG